MNVRSLNLEVVPVLTAVLAAGRLAHIDMKENRIQTRGSYLAVLIAEFIAIMGFAASGPIIPSFLRELGVLDPQSLKLWSGLSNALPSLALALVSPLWGLLADAYGRKPMLLRALFGGAAIALLSSASLTPWHFLTLRTIQGCLTGTVAAATVLVAAGAPEDRLASRLGLLQAAIFTGNSIGPYVGGRVAELFGNRASFIVTSAFLLVGGMIVLLKTVESFEKVSLRDALSAMGRKGRGRLHPALIPLLAVCFMYQCAGSNVIPVLPLYVEQLLGDPARARSVSGLVIGAASVTAALAAAFSGRVSKRLGHGRFLLICLGMAATASALQGLATTVWQILAFRALGGLFLGGTMPAVNALISLRSPPASQGAAFGLSTTAGQAGTALGPVMGAAIAIAAGYRAGFFATAVILGAAAAGVAIFSNRGERAAKA
jgi:DHA1 family multidrug resistance protein-like MFS transporter